MAVGRTPNAARDHDPFGPADMARTLAWFYTAGGVVGMLSLLAPLDPGANVLGLIANCAAAFVSGAAALPRRAAAAASGPLRCSSSPARS